MARSPEQIIGHDALMQLTFEGYRIVPAGIDDARDQRFRRLEEDLKLLSDAHNGLLRRFEALMANVHAAPYTPTA